MRGKSEEGIALIAVLWAIVLLSIVAVTLTFESRSSIRTARNGADTAAARSAADAGIQRAVLDLVAVPTTPTDIRKFHWQAWANRMAESSAPMELFTAGSSAIAPFTYRSKTRSAKSTSTRHLRRYWPDSFVRCNWMRRRPNRWRTLSLTIVMQMNLSANTALSVTSIEQPA